MLQNLINGQYRCPTGLIGRFIGNQMAKAHRPENCWTVAVLRAQPADHILEIGFGPGLAIAELTKVVTQGRIAGVDFSKAMVQSARKRNADAVKRGQVELHHGDAVDLPFEDNMFDKAFSIHSVYFWAHPLAALKEVRRVLKPEGKLVLTILPKERWNEDNPETPVGTPECRPYSGEELAHMLTQVGFQRTQTEVDANFSYRSNFCVIGVK